MADQSMAPKKKPIIIYAIAGLFLFLLVALLLLPSLVSTRWAGEKAKQAVNARIPGQIDFKSLSLSWFDGIRLQDVSYENSDEGIRLTVADIATSKGLLALATNYHDMGEITITRPMAHVTLKEQTAAPEPGKEGGQKAIQPPSDAPPQTADSTSAPIALPPVNGKLIVYDGGVVVIAADKQEKPVVQKLELQLHIAAAENLLDYLLSFQSGDGTGQVDGKGTLTLPSGNIQALDKIKSQATLDIANWQLEDLLTIVANHTNNTPSGSGQLNGHLEISGSTESAVQITGTLNTRKLSLHGGPLKADTPTLDAIDVVIDGAQTATGFTINNLALTSPLANGTVSGSIDNNNKTDITGQMIVDLAELFTQLPSTLSLKKGIKISAGKIGLNVKATADKETLLFSGDARLESLQGVADNKKIAWDKPVALVVTGEQSIKGLKLDDFQVKSSFLNGKGSGDMDNMQIQLAADLDLALKEIEQFIELKGWKGGGKMDLNLQLATKTAPVRAAVGDITINNFALQQKGRVIAPPGPFKAHLTADLLLDDTMHLKELQNTTLALQSWLGTGKVTVASFAPASQTKGDSMSGLEVKSALQLKPVAALLHSLDTLPKDTKLSGATELHLQASLKDDKLELGDTTIDTKDFVFTNTNQKINEKAIHLATRGSADLKNKSVALAPIELQTSAGQLQLAELQVSNWEQAANSLKTSGNLAFDLGLLASQLHDVLKLPKDTTIAGKGDFKLAVDMSGVKQQVVSLEGKIEPVKVNLAQKPALTEEKVQLAVELKGDLHNQNFALNKLEITASPIALSATGKMEPAKNEHQLTSEGSLGLNLQAISSYLKTLSDMDVEMSGDAKRPFTIKAISTKGKWQDVPQHATLSSSFHADSIKAFGVHIQSLDVPVKLADAKAEVDLQGTVNNGKLTVKPAINFAAKPPVATIPENSTVLTKVGISPEMSKDLLAKMHPVFQGAVVSKGTVDLGMKKFSWPLDSAARKDASFDSTLTFNDVKLTAGGLLAPLLSVMKVSEQEISLGTEPVECIAQNERVQCSDLDIQVNDYTISMTGSIGFDQSLDYEAKIPVTKQMVGSNVYTYLEGATINVPIAGTVSKPAISKNVVQKALKDLVSQAGQKQIGEQAGKLFQKLFKQ